MDRECKRHYGCDLYEWGEKKPKSEEDILKLSLDFISMGLDLEYTIEQVKNN